MEGGAGDLWPARGSVGLGPGDGCTMPGLTALLAPHLQVLHGHHDHVHGSTGQVPRLGDNLPPRQSVESELRI